MSSDIISFLMKKVDVYLKKCRMVALVNNATHMRPVQNSDATSNE